MRAAVVGAGPVGLVCAVALAEQGHDVLVVDPDGGPDTDGSWRRHGVMQFHHPHFFRFQVREALETQVPEMWDAVVAAGGIVNPAPEGMPPGMTTMSCRRSTFERALRGVAQQHERVTFVPAYADRVVVDGDRVTGLVVDGSVLPVDVVVAANGRSSRFADELRPVAEGGACGQSYVARMYRARPGSEPPGGFGPLVAEYRGYLTIVFPQDAGTLSALVVRASADKELASLWRTPCFEAAAALIPNLAPWTDPAGFEPITEVMRGGTLTNSYRGQGSPPAGLFFVGDAVCTTNPSAGRGLSLGLRGVGALLEALREHADHRDASAAFDAWCLSHVRPWYDDHVRSDASLLRRYAGQDVDVEGPLPADVVCAAAQVDPSLLPVVGPYQAMTALPATLDAVEDGVRALLRTGWRPALADGPDRDALVAHLGALTGSA
jgi:2-polyprenyl-6-methoxyphenol hydroxylase-like FAD-dependent oxidoreductase